MAQVAVICPDTNIELSVDAPERVAIRGGKSAIVQLGAAWARAGHDVTVFAGRARPGRSGRLQVRPFDETDGRHDVAIYVTGSLGHFRDPVAARAQARVNLFWLNGPCRVEPPQFVDLDWIVAPARFLARRAIDEWGHPPERVAVIPGEAVPERLPRTDAPRDPARAVYASHPDKGLAEALDVLARCRAQGAGCTLDVFGSAALWGVPLDAVAAAGDWARLAGDVPERDVARQMTGYGFMPYFTAWLDGFSTATAEAMAGGAIVFATAHGSNAEFIRHGWNGFLVGTVDGRPNLDEATRLLLHYLRAPEDFEAIRDNARRSVPTWDEQAGEWERLWSR